MRSHKQNSFKSLVGVIALLCAFSSTAFAKEWLVHKTNMNLYDAEVEKRQEEIKLLIEQKRKTEDPAELRVITQGMADHHTEIMKIDKKRRDEILHMRFQHPEKGEHIKREYTRGKIKTLEEMESEFGLDARLNRIQTKVRKTYGIKTEEEKAKEAAIAAKQKEEKKSHELVSDERKPASEAPKRNRNADADERIHFSK